MIVGLERLEKTLDRLASSDPTEPTSKAISLVQESAKANVRVDSGALRESIYTDVRKSENKVTGTCFTNKAYAPFVEFGTGPEGQKNHSGISPDVTVAYRQSPWWIHESMIDKGTAEKYHWPSIETDQGIFYRCTGQPASPFMYPALKDNRENILEIYGDYMKDRVGG